MPHFEHLSILTEYFIVKKKAPEGAFKHFVQ